MRSPSHDFNDNWRHEMRKSPLTFHWLRSGLWNGTCRPGILLYRGLARVRHSHSGRDARAPWR